MSSQEGLPQALQLVTETIVDRLAEVARQQHADLLRQLQAGIMGSPFASPPTGLCDHCKKRRVATSNSIVGIKNENQSGQEIAEFGTDDSALMNAHSGSGEEMGILSTTPGDGDVSETLEQITGQEPTLELGLQTSASSLDSAIVCAGRHQGKFKRCGVPGSVRFDPLIECGVCGLRYHANCQHNKIPDDDQSMNGGYVCDRCRRTLAGDDAASVTESEHSLSEISTENASLMDNENELEFAALPQPCSSHWQRGPRGSDGVDNRCYGCKTSHTHDEKDEIIECIGSCKRRWHQSCVLPVIADHEIKDWWCQLYECRLQSENPSENPSEKNVSTRKWPQLRMRRNKLLRDDRKQFIWTRSHDIGDVCDLPKEHGAADKKKKFGGVEGYSVKASNPDESWYEALERSWNHSSSKPSRGKQDGAEEQEAREAEEMSVVDDNDEAEDGESDMELEFAQISDSADFRIGRKRKQNPQCFGCKSRCAYDDDGAHDPDTELINAETMDTIVRCQGQCGRHWHRSCVDPPITKEETSDWWCEMYDCGLQGERVSEYRLRKWPVGREKRNRLLLDSDRQLDHNDSHFVQTTEDRNDTREDANGDVFGRYIRATDPKVAWDRQARRDQQEMRELKKKREDAEDLDILPRLIKPQGLNFQKRNASDTVDATQKKRGKVH